MIEKTIDKLLPLVDFDNLIPIFNAVNVYMSMISETPWETVESEDDPEEKELRISDEYLELLEVLKDRIHEKLENDYFLIFDSLQDLFYEEYVSKRN